MLKWLGGGGGPGSGGNGAADSFTHVGKVFNVNDYQVVVEELIAEGGFAVVYKTRSPRGQIYALKRMAVNNEQDLYLAKQEIAITKALSDCPHSVTHISSSIRSLSADVHEVLILMPLYSGQSVVSLLNRHLSRRSSLPEREVVEIFASVCVAVGRLHHRTKPIIHRDLKIENILSDKQGTYILCDYGSCTVHTMHPETMGAAKCEDEIARFTTLPYRAPEMVSLYSGKTITTKADIWALGCLLYKLCFMTTPFGEQPLAIVSAQFMVPQNSPYSDQLHSLIRYMLDPDPEKRPTIWQVNEVVCRLQGKKNTMPNVFRSSKPPEVLPRPRKANEKKTSTTTTTNTASTASATPATSTTAAATSAARDATTKPNSNTSSSSSQSSLSTPANSMTKVQTTVTTTSISSRERPRARGGGGGVAGSGGGSGSNTHNSNGNGNPASMNRSISSSSAMAVSRQQQLQQQQQQKRLLLQQHSSTPPATRRNRGGGGGGGGTQSHQLASIEQAHHLSVGQDLRSAQSRSWSAGLDMFGAVPFNTPDSTGISGAAASKPTAAGGFEDVRCDLFGSTPFSSPSSPTSSSSSLLQQQQQQQQQQDVDSALPPSLPSSSSSSSNQGLDDFGSKPFVTCT